MAEESGIMSEAAGEFDVIRSSVESARRRARAGSFLVPGTAEEWRAIALGVAGYCERMRLVPPLELDELRREAGRFIATNGLDVRLSEFVMVMINNALWQDLVGSIPFRKRTLLLPPCLRASGSCPATTDEYGLICEQCGKCCIGRLSVEAERLGYAVLVAEGTSMVERLVEQGSIEAVVGVSCMPSLERSFPYMCAGAIPGLAIPLYREGCADTGAFEDLVLDAIRLEMPRPAFHMDWKGVQGVVGGWFDRVRVGQAWGAGSSQSEAVALEWVTRSGKRWRPLLVVSVYLALRRCSIESLPDDVRLTALAVECIHKASLIYDDIQDNDVRRYGERTVHEVHGVPVALTVSMYLLGQGYRLIANCGAGAKECAEMLRLTSEGHCELSLGQGGELWWMRAPVVITPEEVLAIFRKKTAPSFEVVFRLGAILGGASAEEHSILSAYSLAVGVAYQIQDDLQDFGLGGDVDDIRSCRPSILMALAYAGASAEDRGIVERFWCGGEKGLLGRVREVIVSTGAEDRAHDWLARFRADALAALAGLKNRELKILLYRVVAKMLGARRRTHEVGNGWSVELGLKSSPEG